MSAFFRALGRATLALFITIPLWAIAFPNTTGDDMMFLVWATTVAAFAAFQERKEPSP